MMSQPEPQPEMPTTSSPWTRPPQEPARYRLSDRLSDMLYGWLDGRRGIPQLPEGLSRSVDGAAIPAARSRLMPIVKPSTEPGSASARPRVRTHRMVELSREALQLIEGEKIRFDEESAVLKQMSARSLTLRDALTEEAAVAKEKLEQARSPLSEPEREERRLAEQAACIALVRARRQSAWERRRVAAEQHYQSVTAGLAEATREAQLWEELICDRAATARAAARRHHEFALRRIATYLQQLVRTHRQRADLNLLLMEYPVGPDLPEWTKDPAAGQSGIGQMLAQGSEPMTGDPYLSNETSSP